MTVQKARARVPRPWVVHCDQPGCEAHTGPYSTLTLARVGAGLDGWSTGDGDWCPKHRRRT